MALSPHHHRRARAAGRRRWLLEKVVELPSQHVLKQLPTVTYDYDQAE